MKKKTFAIIGAGLSGCTAALYLKKRGHKVIIYEKSESLGGVAKDLIFDNKVYYNGPNYLSPQSLLIKLIKKESFFKKIIDTQDISYGSYTDIFGDLIVSKEFAHPITSLTYKTPKKIIQPKNLLERINKYPKTIAKEISNWCIKFENKPIDLHQNCSHLMGFGRIYFKNQEKKILDLKKRNKILNEILGVPNYKKTDKICVPINGFNNFFKVIQKHLIRNGIKIKFLSKVNISKIGNEFLFTNLKKKIDADCFIIASNPVPLINCLDVGKLDNPIVKYDVLTCDLGENSKKVKNFYIQVFSKKSNIFRIYLFNTFKKNKVVIEILKNKVKINLDDEIDIAQKILFKFNINFKIKKKFNLSKQIRHFLFTVKDYKKFMKFEKISNNSKIIGGGWYLLGSKLKMDHIKKNIDKL